MLNHGGKRSGLEHKRSAIGCGGEDDVKDPTPTRTVCIHVIVMFYPVAVETLGVLADEAHEFISEIGRRASTAYPRETTFLYQRISAAIQRFNAVCLSNTFTISESPL